jgi:hypothetical protein
MVAAIRRCDTRINIFDHGDIFMPTLGSRRARLGLERLGDRINPTGTIVTKFSSGVLSITESASTPGTSQNIALLGASEGHVSISVQDGETISGKNSFNHVTKVVVKLGNGDDTVTVVDLKLSRRGDLFNFQGGNGNNTVFFDGLNINIDTVKVTSGSGTLTYGPSNEVQQTFGSIDIEAPTSVGCSILLGGMGVSRTTKVVTGGGADSIAIDNAIFTGTVTINTGGGNDSITMGQIQPTDGQDVTFNGAVNIDMGDGNDSLSAGVKWHGPSDGTKPDFVNFNGTVTFDGGTGSDTIDVWHPRSTSFNLEGYPQVDNWETIVYAP